MSSTCTKTLTAAEVEARRRKDVSRAHNRQSRVRDGVLVHDDHIDDGTSDDEPIARYLTKKRPRSLQCNRFWP